VEPKDPAKGWKWKYCDTETREKLRAQYQEHRAQHQAYLGALTAWKNDPAVRAAPAKLDATIHDLEKRGLLQFDQHERRYDLHPVVRNAFLTDLRPNDEKTEETPTRTILVDYKPVRRIESVFNIRRKAVGKAIISDDWSKFLLQRIEVAKIRVAKFADGPISIDCFRILDFIKKERPDRIYVFTLEALCEITNRATVDNDLVAALNLLAGSGLRILAPKLVFVDNDNLFAEDNLYEVSWESLIEARVLGELAHPRLGRPIVGFEQFIIPIFRLGPALTGANQ
jgi:hypothetical protein